MITTTMIEPRSEAELSEEVAGAAAPLEIIGGGTRRTLGRPVQAAQIGAEIPGGQTAGPEDRDERGNDEQRQCGEL